MEFQVSARKWRPQKFNELIGQEHIVRTLTNAIQMDRIAHAYLFCGTRGVGKTTTARILAKALNCGKGLSSEPCGECSFCVEIKEGSSVDVREIDGASNNGVAEVRELIEKIQYAASSCRYKIYIIDEVHMLSKSAFNALLKTLEEPPPNVVFIFATTELNKIPETILSRCQCFEFKPLSHKQIIRQLEVICKQEKIEIDSLSLEEIGKNGAGSMRDSQSLLDQVIAYCGKEVGSGSVESVLGIVGQKVLEDFVDQLISRDGAAMIGLVQDIASQGKDLNYFCRDLAEYLRNLLMVKIAKSPGTILDTHSRNLEVLRRQAEALHADELQQMFTVLARTEMEMKRSSLSHMVFEMAVLRLADVRPFRNIDEMVRQINQAEEERPASGTEPSGQKESTGKPTETRTDSGGNNSESTETLPESPQWEKIKAEVCKKRPVFNHYLAGCQVVIFDTSTLHLSFGEAYLKELVEEKENVSTIKDAVRALYKYEVKVLFSLNEGAVTSNNPPENKKEKKTPNDYNKGEQKSEAEVIQDALDIFGGVVIK